MEEIIDNLYLGSFAEVQDIKDGVNSGFSACLSVGCEFLEGKDNHTTIFHSFDKIILANLNSIGIEHKILSIDDGVSNCICNVLPEALLFIDKYISKGNVYVHCFAGVSRSPSIVYAYMLSKGYDPIHAFVTLTNKRGQVYPYYDFIKEILIFFKMPSDKILNEIKSGLYTPLKKCH